MRRPAGRRRRCQEPACRPRRAEGEGRQDGLRDARQPGHGVRVHQRQRWQGDRADRAQDTPVAGESPEPRCRAGISGRSARSVSLIRSRSAAVAAPASTDTGSWVPSEASRILQVDFTTVKTRQTPTLLETALQHDRRVMLFVLVAIPFASWTWIVLMARDMYGTMGGASAWMMTPVWNWPHVLL